jgi:hypothetical protein
MHQERPSQGTASKALCHISQRSAIPAPGAIAQAGRQDIISTVRMTINHISQKAKSRRADGVTIVIGILLVDGGCANPSYPENAPFCQALYSAVNVRNLGLAQFEGLQLFIEETETHLNARMIELLTPIQQRLLLLLDIPETIYALNFSQPVQKFLDAPFA